MSSYIKRRRRTLWNESPCCRRCGVLTILPEHLAIRMGVDESKLMRILSDGKQQAVRAIVATLEHTRSRLNPERGRQPAKKQEGKITTLFCYECNQESGRAELMSKGFPLEVQINGHI